MNKGKEFNDLIKIVHRCLLHVVFVFNRFVYHSNTAQTCRKLDSVELLNKVHHYVVTENHFLDKDLNVQKVALHFKIRKEQLNKIFRKKYNLTFAGYLKKLRIEHACVLLLDPSNMLIDVVAEKVCFNNSRTFDRSFKALYNMTPSEFRRIQRIKKFHSVDNSLTRRTKPELSKD